MTAANTGASTPEDDDPFGYLYEDGQAAGATPPGQGRGYGYPGPAAQPGVPRTSYNQVRTVGERRQYGQQVPPQQAYGQPTAHYAAPETYPGAAAQTRQVPIPAQQGHGGGHGGGRSGGPNTKGLLIGAIAVVAVVVIGITAALINGGDEKNKAGHQPGAGGSPTAAESVETNPEAEPEEEPVSGELPKQDAATLRLGPPAALAKDVKGAEGADGAYVTGFNAVGASVTWNANLDKEGAYRLYVRYAIPAKDANATLTVNGEPNSNPIGLKNFIDSDDPNYEKNWQTTWAPVSLQKGENTIKLSCEAGNQCDVILDWVEVRTA
jgi:hypothetical protein